MISTWRQFFDLVVEVRKWQKQYFSSKSQFALERSKQKEAELDAAIEHQKQKWADAAQGKLPLGGQ